MKKETKWNIFWLLSSIIITPFVVIMLLSIFNSSINNHTEIINLRNNVNNLTIKSDSLSIQLDSLKVIVHKENKNSIKEIIQNINNK